MTMESCSTSGSETASSSEPSEESRGSSTVMEEGSSLVGQSTMECSSSSVSEAAQELRSKRRRFRPNTLQEKRRMRNRRKKRKRQQQKHSRALLKESLQSERTRANEARRAVVQLKSMSRTYWERWRWELEKRKELMIQSTRVGAQLQGKPVVKPQVHEINPTMLTDPVINEEKCVRYLGRGSFGIVKFQIYRGMHVAVKEMLPRSVRADVIHEAEILATFCHPYLPCLFGVCTRALPLRIVMQFHGVLDGPSPRTVTVLHELEARTIGLVGMDWLTVCAQLFEAINYLHNEAGIIHNDIKTDNILIGSAGESPTTSASSGVQVQILLIDFGKAVKITNGKLYRLTHMEKEHYRERFPHIAPEVVDGVSRQSPYSDMFSAGGVLNRIADRGSLLPQQQCKLLNVAEHCRRVRYHSRISANKALIELLQSC